MTAQFHDRVLYQGEDYSLVGVKEPLFDPLAHGLHPVGKSTACWRGFVCTYRVEEQLFLEALHLYTDEPAPVLFGVSPHADEPPSSRWDAVYEHLGHPLAYSGGLLVARGFIQELYMHMGFHPAWKYEEVHELLFEEGMLRQETDRSAQMAALRSQLASRPLSPTTLEDRAEIEQWISQYFSQEYD